MVWQWNVNDTILGLPSYLLQRRAKAMQLPEHFFIAPIMTAWNHTVTLHNFQTHFNSCLRSWLVLNFLFPSGVKWTSNINNQALLFYFIQYRLVVFNLVVNLSNSSLLLVDSYSGCGSWLLLVDSYTGCGSWLLLVDSYTGCGSWLLLVDSYTGVF